MVVGTLTSLLVASLLSNLVLLVVRSHLKKALKEARKKPTRDAQALMKELLNGKVLLNIEVMDREGLFQISPKGLL